MSGVRKRDIGFTVLHRRDFNYRININLNVVIIAEIN